MPASVTTGWGLHAPAGDFVEHVQYRQRLVPMSDLLWDGAPGGHARIWVVVGPSRVFLRPSRMAGWPLSVANTSDRRLLQVTVSTQDICGARKLVTTARDA